METDFEYLLFDITDNAVFVNLVINEFKAYPELLWIKLGIKALSYNVQKYLGEVSCRPVKERPVSNALNGKWQVSNYVRSPGIGGSNPLQRFW